MKRKIVLFPFVFGFILALVVKSASAYTVTVSKSGVVTTYREVVLGDDDERGAERKEEKRGEVKREESRGESVKKEMEIKRENLKVEVSGGGRPKIEVKQERRENKAEVEKMQKARKALIKESEKKTEEGTLTESQRETMKQRIEVEKKKEEELGERTIKKAEDDEVGVEVEDGVKVESVDGELEIEHEGDRVRTDLPVVIDVDTKRIKVKSPETGQETEVEGVGTVTDDLRERGIIDDLSETKTGTPQSELKKNEAGELVYDLTGTKKEKLFGLLSVELAKQIEVSAQTGDVVKVNQTFVSRLLDLFSF